MAGMIVESNNNEDEASDIEVNIQEFKDRVILIGQILAMISPWYELLYLKRVCCA